MAAEAGASSTNEASASSANSDAAAHSHPQFIPVYKEPEPDTASYEMLPTAAPPTGDIEIPREPELQETADETTRATVADRVEPGLLSTFEADPAPARKAIAEEQPAAWSSGNNFNVAETSSATAMEVTPVQSEQSPDQQQRPKSVTPISKRVWQPRWRLTAMPQSPLKCMKVRS